MAMLVFEAEELEEVADRRAVDRHIGGDRVGEIVPVPVGDGISQNKRSSKRPRTELLLLDSHPLFWMKLSPHPARS